MALHHQASQTHFLLVTFPAYGHINPALQFAELLTRTGARVTFVTTVYAHLHMLNTSNSKPNGLTFATFSDGYDEGYKKSGDTDQYMSEISRRGSEALSNLVERFNEECCPVSCLVYTLALTWAAEVAHKFQLSSALLWVQPATVFDIYYYYFNGHKDLIIDNINDPSYSVKLPGLPLLKGPDLPSFLLPSNSYAFGMKLFEEQFELLSQEPKSFRVLVNTFDELEPDALKAIENVNLIGIGPLIPSACLNGEDPLREESKDYIEWLDLKDTLSVVYVSFGSIAVLTNKQMEELARGLVDSERPFLWVIRSGGNGINQVQDVDEAEKYTKILLGGHQGLIVPWCSQVEVLNHPSIGCFMTHCGWNSTLETLAMGVPTVAFPQWVEQGTNAKLMEDVWKMGVRVRPNGEDNIVTSEEIIRCLEEVMEGENGKEIRENAKKWKQLAREAVKEGGSSEKNIRAFVKDVRQQ